VRAIVAAALLLLAAGPAPADEKLVRPLADAEVDWAAGTITARGGAAADMGLPTAEMARPGAERRARADALAKLRAALAELPVAPSVKLHAAAVDAALARAHRDSVDYQSNGGVLLTLGLAFAELRAPKDKPPAPDAGAEIAKEKEPAHALAVASMPFELAPRIVAGEHEASSAWAVYRQGPAPSNAIAVRRDKAGRLVLPKGEAKALQKLAGAPVVIYVQKSSR
jgi:hypothetical protein